MMIEELKNIYHNHHELRQNSINLLPSENVLSPLARKFLSSDMGQRYFFKSPFNGENGIVYSYSGTEYVEKIINIGEEVAKEIFGAEYVSLYPVSGHQANLAVLFAFTQPGDSIMVFDSKLGGYPGLDKDKLPNYLKLKVFYFQTIKYSPELIDYEKTIKLIKKIKPKLVIYSSAHTLFPVDIKTLANVSHEVNAKFIYDGSHPLGLISGGIFQNPLKEGADVLIAGTQKSFPGPQGGLIATNKYDKELEKVNHFVIIDNPHFHRIASLVTSLIEMKMFGREYAKQVVKNAKTLALELSLLGFDVKYSEKDFTESHMFKLNINDGYRFFVKNLEKANIMIDSAGRIGVAEMTRYGMQEKEMKNIAELIYQATNPKGYSILKQEVKRFRKNFQIVHYC